MSDSSFITSSLTTPPPLSSLKSTPPSDSSKKSTPPEWVKLKKSGTDATIRVRGDCIPFTIPPPECQFVARVEKPSKKEFIPLHTWCSCETCAIPPSECKPSPPSGGIKYDNDKLRFDLVPPFAQEQYVRVLTMGSKKYGDRNWEKGMDWSRIIASLERHLHAVKLGEDYDKESGLLHMAHVMTNSAFLLEYYKIFPQGDNRSLPYHRNPRIGLDIDEVLADFIGEYSRMYGIERAESWDFDPKIKERIEELKENKEFWLNIPVKTRPQDIPFEPICYITSRPCPKEWTVEWLHKNGFPSAPVHCTYKKSKVEVAKECGVQWFVDDRYSNFVELNEAKVCCFLFDAPHNQRYDVGCRRIKSLKELPL